MEFWKVQKSVRKACPFLFQHRRLTVWRSFLRENESLSNSDRQIIILCVFGASVLNPVCKRSNPECNPNDNFVIIKRSCFLEWTSRRRPVTIHLSKLYCHGMQTFLEYLVNLREVQIDFELHYFAFEGGIEKIYSKLVSTLANTLTIIVVHNKRVNRLSFQRFLAHTVGLPFNTNSPSMAFSYSLFSSVKEVRVHGDIKRPNYYSIYLSVVQLYSVYKVEGAELFPSCSSARYTRAITKAFTNYTCEK